MRVTRFVLLLTALAAASVNAAQAQTTLRPDEGRFLAMFTVAATLGHKSDSSVGVEVGGRLTDSIEVFIEAGRMGNVATSTLDTRASVIANFIKGSASAVQKATFFDIGVKYRGPVIGALPGMWRPYIGIGVGTAKVNTTVNFAVNGTDVTAQLLPLYGIELGNDLSDSLNKTFVVVPLGIQGRFMDRFVVDAGYRYGRISARPEDIDNDVAIGTQRVQVGFGVRF